MNATNANPAGAGSLWIGTSGFAYKGWKGPFYPAKGCPTSRWLEFYAQHFPTVEVNSTFYRPMSADVVRRWADRVEVNPRFRFAMKLWKRFTW